MKYVFLGSQGSGKSTQARLLAEKLHIPYIEMGQLLRERSKENDELSHKINKALDAGNIVENQITINLLKSIITKNDYLKGYVLDGYPRNNIQLQALEPNISKAFYIKVSDEVAIKRLSKRGRHDDTSQALINRLNIYHRETEPLLGNFKEKGILIEINGERSIEEIHIDILNRVVNEH